MSQAPTAAGPIAGKTILIVDDERDIQDILVAQFEDLGANCLRAINGVQALDFVKMYKLDLIISDVRMPGGGGVQLLEEVKRSSPTPPPTLFITGYSDLTEESARRLGAVGLVPKPFRPVDIFKVVSLAWKIPLSALTDEKP